MFDFDSLNLSRASFLAWLNERLDAEVGRGGMQSCCPLACWIKSLIPGCRNVYVIGYNMLVSFVDDEYNAQRIALPDWTAGFIKKIDLATPAYGPVTGQQAKAILLSLGE